MESTNGNPVDPATSPDYVRGVLCGVQAWLVYGLIESWFLIVQPWVFEPRYTYRPLHLGVALTAVVVYGGVGALVGAAVATLRRSWPGGAGRAVALNDPWPRIAGVASLLVAGALVTSFRSGDVRHLAYGFGLLALAGTALIAGRTNYAARMRFLISPWVASLLLIYPPWMGGQISSVAWYAAPLRLRAIAVTIVVILVAGWVAQGLLYGRRWAHLGPRSVAAEATRTAIVFAAATGLCLVGWWLRPVVLTAAPPAARASASLPSIVLISLDTVAAGHLSLYGYSRATSPHLERFAERATTFLNAFSTSDYTLPSHASMFTGAYGSEHGARFWPGHGFDIPLSPKQPNVTALLANAGYVTAGVVANYGYLSYRYGMNRGFAHYDARPPSVMLVEFPRYTLRRGLFLIATAWPSLAFLKRDYEPAAHINQELFAILDEPQFSTGPSFLFVNYMDGHTPYQPPAPFDRLFHGGGPEEDLVAQYDGSLAYLDSQIGMLFSKLEQVGLYDNALIIVTSDHGEAFGAHGYWGHYQSVYQDQVNVPLVVKFPGQRSPAKVAAPSSGVDIFPTILAAARLPVPAQTSGADLARLAESEPRQLVMEHFGGRAGQLGGQPEIIRAMVAFPFKVIVPAEGDPELFDLSRDSGETQNLFDARSSVHRDLARDLRDWTRRAEQRMPDMLMPSQDAIDRLRSLGYVK